MGKVRWGGGAEVLQGEGEQWGKYGGGGMLRYGGPGEGWGTRGRGVMAIAFSTPPRGNLPTFRSPDAGLRPYAL